MKSDKKIIALFILPCVLSVAIMYLYPVVRSVAMSFFSIGSLTAPLSEWSFAGVSNYLGLFYNASFIISLKNIAKIWLLGGALSLGIALIFAAILSSGIRFKKFYRAAIYLPNIISAVAMATMWIQYVFSYEYGLLNNIINIFGLESIKWLGTDLKFYAMLIAFVYGSIGYYMLVFLSGIEQIPQELYDAATVDGANRIQQFFEITLPLLRNIFATNVTFWTVSVLNFFLWSKMFSPIGSEGTTITPVVYMYDLLFGNEYSASVVMRDAGVGATIGVILALCVVVTHLVVNKLLKTKDLEY